MRKLMPVFAALALFGSASIATAQETQVEKTLKALGQKVEQLEKKVADLTKQLAQKEKELKDLKEKKKGGTLDEIIDGLLGGKGLDMDKLMETLQEKLQDVLPGLPGLEGMPGMPDLENLPDLFEGLKGMDFESLIEPLKGQLQEQFGEFFEGGEAKKFFEQFREMFKNGGKATPKNDDNDIYWM